MKKSLSIGVILLFLLSALAPSISADSSSIDFINKNASVKKTLYYCESSVGIIRYPGGGWGAGGAHSSHSYFLHFDADLEELIIEVVMNYSAVMEYNLRFPYPLAPIFAFGLKIENYTVYVWETFKLEHNGYAKQEGNISVVINIDMNQYENGSIECLQPYFVSFYDHSIRHSTLLTPNNELSYTLIMRILYNIPIFSKSLLHNWFLPKLAPYKQLKGCNIWLYFH